MRFLRTQYTRNMGIGFGKPEHTQNTEFLNTVQENR